MSPPSANVETAVSSTGRNEPANTKAAPRPFPTPLKYSGSLNNYEHFDVTAIIGREFPKVQLSEIVNDDTKLRDLAITGKIIMSLV